MMLYSDPFRREGVSLSAFCTEASTREISWIKEWAQSAYFTGFALKTPYYGVPAELVALIRPFKAAIIGTFGDQIPGEKFPPWIEALPVATFNVYDYPEGHVGPIYMRIRTSRRSWLAQLVMDASRAETPVRHETNDS